MDLWLGDHDGVLPPNVSGKSILGFIRFTQYLPQIFHHLQLQTNTTTVALKYKLNHSMQKEFKDQMTIKKAK